MVREMRGNGAQINSVCAVRSNVKRFQTDFVVANGGLRFIKGDDGLGTRQPDFGRRFLGAVPDDVVAELIASPADNKRGATICQVDFREKSSYR